MSQCIKELSLDDRPREKLMQQGAAGLSNSELLAILIRTGTQKRSALRIAEELTASSGLYQNIACVHSVAELAKVKGLGPAKAATILAALELGKRIAAAGSQVKLKIESPQKGAEILLPRLRYEQHEKFLVLLLDSKNQVIRMEQVSEGSVNSSVVHPREVFAPALLYHAAAILVAHNHPSGIAKASKEDMEVTKNFAANVEGFLGHIIIGSTNRYSIIEEDSEGRILVPKEQILDNSVLNTVEEKLIDNSFYNMKISSRDELIALFMKMQNNREYSTAILTDTQNNIRMVVDIPNKMLNQSIENLNGFLKNLGRNLGANKVFIGTHDQKTYFKIIEHQRYGTFKDMVFIDNYNRIITQKMKDSPNLFDKEKREKSRKNRDAR